MAVIDLMPGVKLWKGADASILFGSPPEVIKVLMVKNEPFPENIVLPDTAFRGGVLQNCTEFPLYYYLFVLGNYFKGGKLAIAGEARAVADNRELLRLTLLGPTREEYAELGASPHFDTLYSESRYLAVKDKAGGEVPIDGFIDFVAFKKGSVELRGVTVRHQGHNLYEVGGEKIDLRTDEEQIPVYDVRTDFVPMVPHRFGVDILGGGSGFTPCKPSSAVLLNYNSDFMMIDCLPYLDFHLRQHGISKQQIKSLYLTHIHDDHCNIFPLVLFHNKLKFLGTKEIFRMAMKKLALQTGHRMEEFAGYFDFVEMEPYRENDFYGITVVPHYTVHSIPTIGATFTMNVRGKTHTIAFGGDNKALPEIAKMAELGVTPREKYDYLVNLYRRRYNVLMADGGMGLLHGNPEDSLSSQADRVVFMHLERLPEKFDATFSMAHTGKRYVLEDSKSDSYLIKTMEIFRQSFPGMSEEWMTAIMNNLSVSFCNAGDVIFKQGEERKGSVYIILSGTCSVMFHDGVRLSEIAVKDAGEFIGDMAVVRGEPTRSASVVAKTPVILCEVDERIFFLFLQEEGRIENLLRMWEIRRELEKKAPFDAFPDYVNDKIARAGIRRTVKKGETLVHEGDNRNEFFIILDGEFSVARGGRKFSKLASGDLFGEIGALEGRLRNATVTALADSAVLTLSGEAIRRIVQTTPSFSFVVNQVIQERAEEKTAED